MKKLLITIVSIFISCLMLIGFTGCNNQNTVSKEATEETEIAFEDEDAAEAEEEETEYELDDSFYEDDNNSDNYEDGEDSDDYEDDEYDSDDTVNDDNDDASETYVSYKNLYADILRNSDKRYFEVIYVDNDDIPELVCFNGWAHLDNSTLYTVYNNKAVKVGEFGAYGSMAYAKKKNRIFGYTGLEENDKLEAKYTYMISKGKAKHAPDYKGYKIKVTGNDNYYKNKESNINKVFG